MIYKEESQQSIFYMAGSLSPLCKNCMWHDNFSWACFNGRSPYCADFTDDGCTCEYWEKSKAKN